jgi:hypothetical protein
VSLEEVRIVLGLKNYDPPKAGKEKLLEAISHIQTLPGVLQGDIANLLFAFVDEGRSR